ncbi:MAG TPA: ATP-binding protein [Solirubrobacteraceae bacterium]|nr:ATP-binding protein [Solirubrobacteraceae bacterium]
MAAAAPAAAGLDLEALSQAARRVTGSEALLVILRESGGARILHAAGLKPWELEAVQRGIQVGDPDTLTREFPGVLSAELRADGVPGESLPRGDIHALRRGPEGFENEDLIGTFAAQIGLSLAVAQRPPVHDEMFETWAMLDRLVLSAHSLGELGRALTDVIGPLFCDARIGVMVADRQRSMLQMMTGAFGADDVTVASHRVSFFDPRSNSARVFTTGLPYISNASAGDSSIRQDYVDVFALRRVLTIPLGQIGVLHIADGTRDFTLGDLERAVALAPRIGSIVELATTLFRTRREQRVEETISRVAVAIASGASIHTVLPPALEELLEATEATLVAFVPDDAPPIVARAGAIEPELEAAVLDEAGADPGMRAYVIGPVKAGDPGRAAFYAPVTLGATRIGTLAAMRVRGEPFARSERQSFMRMANVAALNYATERYQQQRAELARLQERQRIADDLHDDVAQILFAAQLPLDSILQGEVLTDDVAQRIARARGLLIRGDTAIRTVIHRLSRPPAADIATRLASVVAGVEEEFSIAVHLQVERGIAQATRHLARPASDALVKVAREALVNAVKHAGPCRITVELALEAHDRLRLTIADDGFGARPCQGGHHHGLRAIDQLVSDQGGTLSVSCGATGGTTVVAGMPASDAPLPSLSLAPAEPPIAAALGAVVAPVDSVSVSASV